MKFDLARDSPDLEIGGVGVGLPIGVKIGKLFWLTRIGANAWISVEAKGKLTLKK
jgi:hypothetical protein